jgi:Mg2+-importing ATPase
MTDLPAMTMATDRVDREVIEYPRRWNLKFIRRFMITFGVLSSFFDFLAFGVLWFILRANEITFRSGWVLESVISSALIVLVIRTRKPFYRSVPGMFLLAATLVDVVVMLLLPSTYVGRLFALVPLPAVFLWYLLGIVIVYFISAEVMKMVFYNILQRERFKI